MGRWKFHWPPIVGNLILKIGCEFAVEPDGHFDYVRRQLTT